MQETQEKKVLAYCSTCQQTLNLILRSSASEIDFIGYLFKIAYVHKGPQGEAAHALMMHFDKNFSVRKTEVIDMTIANSTLQGEEFNITTFCQKCQQDLDIPISILRFNQAIKTRGFYNQIFIHGSPSHALLTLIDSQREIIRAEITDLNFDLSLEQSEFIPRMEAPERYLLLDSRKMPSTIFKALFLFDRRSKTVVEFYEKERFSLNTIASQMEQKIGPLEKRGEVIEMLAMSRDQKEYVYIMFDYNVVIVGVDFNKTYIPWLETLVQALLLETEMPNTLGLEIFLQLMERDLNSPKIHNVKTWSDILYSPLYSVNFIFENQRRINRVLRQLDKGFPNVATLFRQCSEGKCSVLEVLNTETGLKNFDEFLELISYLEEKKLF
ncbi:MAG: hypothetical protein ACFFC7_10930 [Candidatus Hermodarchaeota archaeon]